MTVPGRSPSDGGTRRARHGRTALLASTLAAAAIHLAAIGAASAVGLFSGWGGMTTSPAGTAAATAPATPVLPLRPSCDGDAILAVAARAPICLSPFAEDIAACVDELALRLESDRLRCHVEDLAPVEIALTPRVDPRRLPQLDPEKLLEELTPPPPLPTPPPAPVPPPQVAQAEPAKQAPPPPPPRPREEQIIETVKPTEEQPPDDTRFMSDYNTRVAKETVARGTPKEDMVAKPKPAELEVKESPRDPSLAEPPKEDTVGEDADAPRIAGALRMRQPGAPNPAETPEEARTRGDVAGSAAPVGDGLAARRGDGRIASEERRPSELPRGDGGGGGGTPRVPDLRASKEVLERALGGGSVDHLEGVEEGEETALNSKQFVFASFFNRMKRRVAQNWDPMSAWRQSDLNPQALGAKSRLTRLRVTLASSGQVKNIVIVQPSGIDALDDEAVRAFRAAQPFPNPPAAMFDQSGTTTFTFGFHVETDGGRSSWKIFRGL